MSSLLPWANGLLVLFLALCPITALTNPTDIKAQKNRAEVEYPLIQWTDLMPPDDLEALLNPPAYLDEIPDGSPEDQIGNSAGTAKDDRYQQALVSTRVRPEFDQRKIKIPGFVVPLEFNDEMVITEFFLVPFFGACIHVPPPPPNQMIHIR